MTISHQESIDFDKALAEVKKKYRDAGVNWTQWAAKHGFDRAHVYAVLNGQTKCKSGEAYHIGVALGLITVPKGMEDIAAPRRAAA